MPASRSKLRKQSLPRSSGSGKVGGGHCQHTGRPFFPNLAKARKAAGEDEESRSCSYCRGAHNWPSKRRKK